MTGFKPKDVDADLVHVRLADQQRACASQTRRNSGILLTGVLPRNAVPTVVGYGIMSISSLTATGTPSKTPSALPALKRSVDSRA
jgi:hypothetical protein